MEAAFDEMLINNQSARGYLHSDLGIIISFLFSTGHSTKVATYLCLELSLAMLNIRELHWRHGLQKT
jgi:hypothetical protein